MADRGRRYGHGGGRPPYNNYNAPVNPWQGGVVPGNKGVNASPLSQLTDTQAQLALALTNLLRPQQVQQSVPPSLLSLPPMAPMNKNPYMQENFRGNRFDSRSNRPDYQKNRNYHGADRQNFSARKNQQNKSGYRTSIPDKSKLDKKGNSSKESTSQSKSTEDKSDADIKILTDENNESDENKKRDWKDEKNIKEPMEVDDDKPKSSENKDNGEDGKNGTVEKSKKSESPKKKSNYNEKYEGIPETMLQCMVCQKHMWDPESFEKHLKGRAHQLMMDRLEESCRIKAGIMREAMRFFEEKKSIELNRMKRFGKISNVGMVSHCNMCDIDFHGKLQNHRKTPGHQKLKNFIHPRCIDCHKEFQTRLEWECHRFTPEHMRMRIENLEKKKNKIDGTPDISIEEEDSAAVDPANIQDFEDEFVTLSENVIYNYTENMDLSDLEQRLPNFSINKPVGKSLIAPISGHFCEPCKLFFPTENAAKAHLISLKHYTSFIHMLREKQKEMKLKNEKKHAANEAAENEEVNSKRRKLSDSEKDEKLDETAAEEEKDAPKIEDVYDPMDAENESETEIEESAKPICKLELSDILADKKSANISTTVTDDDAEIKLETVDEPKVPTRTQKARRGRKKN